MIELENQTLDELIVSLRQIGASEDRMERGKDVDAVKSAFYRLLGKLKAEAEEAGEDASSKFAEQEETFKSVYSDYRKEKAEYNREQDAQRVENLEKKREVLAQLKELVENLNDIHAGFPALRELQAKWREIGPVPATDFRDVNDSYQFLVEKFYDMVQINHDLRDLDFRKNLEAKEKLCEEVEAIANREDVKDAGEWNALSKQIEDIQARWKTIGFATKSANQKIYERFRAACDKFYAAKRDYFLGIKEGMDANIAKKEALIAQAEELKTSTDWKKATDQFISLQKQWKEVGAVPRKKSEQLWKRFRAACDEFFAERDKNAKPENDFYANLKAKRALIAEIKAWKPEDGTSPAKAQAEFNERWKAIGFVPFKEKDAIAREFREAMHAAFPPAASPVNRKNDLIRRYNALQQDIVTYENNIGFFSNSKGSSALVAQMQQRIESAKAELKALEEQIRKEESQA